MRQDTKVAAEAEEFAAGTRIACRRRGIGLDRGVAPLLRRAAERSSGSTWRRPRTTCSALVGPSGCGKSTLLELVAGLREPDAGEIDGGRRADARGRLARCAYMPQRDLLLPWFSAIDNAAWPCATAASRRGARAGRGGATVRALRPGGLRARAPGRALGRHAPAGRLPAHPARRQAGAAARRAVRLARRDHPRRDAGLAGRRARRRPAHRRPRHATTSRRRSTSATASPCSRRGRRAWSRAERPGPRAPPTATPPSPTPPSSPSASGRCGRCARGHRA